MSALISKPTIQSLFFDSGIDPNLSPLILPAPLYVLPALDWVSNDFARAFVGFRDEWLGNFEPGCTVCFDFAAAAQFFARAAYRKTFGHPAGTTLAWGCFHFQINGDPERGHAVNVIVAEELDSLCLRFFEPQGKPLPNLLTLNDQEIKSCTAAIF